MEMAVYNHTSISLQGPALRLVRLLRGIPLDSIRCEIFDAWLTESEGGIIPYQALSYTWGSTENAAEIIIKDCKMSVTENLHSALLHLRLEDIDRILWIDAICINQENLQERAHQVQQMGDIYRKAEEVLIWLGQATKETDIAMDSMSQLHKEITQIGSNWRQSGQTWMNSQLFERLALTGVYKDWRDEYSMRRDGLKVLLRRSWFQRIWVLQEVANARVALVVCGRKSVSAGTFALVPSMIQLPLDEHCRAVLDIMPGISRKESWWSEKRDLYTLLVKFGGSQATDPRDRIFALLGMSTDAYQDKILRADYTKSDQQVVRDCILFLIPCAGADELLFFRSTIPQFLSKLPSIFDTVRREALLEGRKALVQYMFERDGVDVNAKIALDRRITKGVRDTRSENGGTASYSRQR
ncbi:HET-domain-containing protein [Stipitochalara longipes BDJ]|nr:HET-domain-containing protein [Stipitochalara longipes BDJ]